MESKIIYHKPENYVFDEKSLQLYNEINNIKEPIVPTNLSYNLKYYNNDQDIIIEPKDGNYEYVIILLHGLGVSPINLSKIFFKGIFFPKINKTKFIFPKGSELLFTKDNKFYFKYDEKEFSVDDNYMLFLEKSNLNVFNIIENEAKIVGYKNIFLGGSSIGGISSYYIGYNLKEMLGGLILMNATFYLDINILDDKKNLKVFVGEGILDKGAHSEQCKKHIEKIINFPNVEVHYYEDGKHDICDGELIGINNFLNKNII